MTVKHYDKEISLILESFHKILEHVEEGIHIVDFNGVTCLYNKAMSDIEGFTSEQVIGKHLLEIFPDWQIENSTLLTVLSTGEPIYAMNQQYLNLKGKHITTLNTTLPLKSKGQIIGAMEIARNLTTVSHMSAQIIALQQALFKPNAEAKIKKQYDFNQMIGNTEIFDKARKAAIFAAASQSNVLLFGETGTGKELFAQSIHSGSRRCEKPFIAQNCAAIPETLLEGILFGTTKGAYTGAVDRPGLFEQANGGTLFLDEINNMPISLQVKLLRVLQEKVVRRIGGLKEVPVDVRIISATNELPEILLAQGLLRRDLFYRINVLYIPLPSLSERKSDISLLAKYFISHYNDILEKNVEDIDPDFLGHLMNRRWLGNVRELQNVIEVAMNATPNEERVLKANKFLPEMIFPSDLQSLDTEVVVTDLNGTVEAYERKLILQALLNANYNVSKAARALNVSRQNLQYKINKYKLEL